MTPQIRVQGPQLADWTVIQKLPREQLVSAVEAVENLPPYPTTAAEIRKALASGVDMSAAEALLRQMLALQGLAAELDLSSGDIFDGLKLGLRPGEARWGEKEFEAWVSLSDLFKRLFELEVLQLSAKALNLSYEHSELLRHARILTDVRPVFDKDANQVRGSVISHSLLLRYDDANGDHVLSLAIDENDIRSIIRQCERALKKSQTLQSYLEDRAKLPTIVPGRGKDD